MSFLYAVFLENVTDTETDCFGDITESEKSPGKFDILDIVKQEIPVEGKICTLFVNFYCIFQFNLGIHNLQCKVHSLVHQDSCFKSSRDSVLQQT